MARPEFDPPVDIREHLAAIVDSSDDAILSKTLDGRILSWNKGAEKLYGYTADEIVGRPITTLVPCDRPDEVNGILARVAAGDVVEHFETIRVRKDGTVLPVSLTISPVRDGEGRIVAASTIARDITERRQADELRCLLAAIVDSSDDAILSKTLDGTILSWNKGAEKLFGYTSQEIVGQPMTVLVQGGRPEEVDGILARARAGEALEHFETAWVRKDGTAVPVSLTISPIRDGEGQIVAASTVARDISERKRFQAELEAARDRALEISRLKSDFLATMSHEIRTPMNGVIGMTGLLLGTELDPDQREYAETVRRSGEALLAIINDILDFSKVEAGKLELEIIDFDLRVVIEEVADLLAEQAHAKGLELATLVAPDVPTAVRGDPGRIRQVLTNLVGNALKFTHVGEVVVRAVEAHEEADDVVVRIDVVDTGIGIRPELRSVLFEPFSQADSSTTRTFGGTGLGLAISKQLVELMGGEIDVESEPGEGSTFTFTLRLAKQPGPAQEATMRPDLNGLNVLIVDDNATNRKILAHQVTSWGMRMTSVGGGPEALEVLRSANHRGEGYDVALIDMDMPGMDGVDLARAICADPALAPIPLVLLTSSATRGSAAAARKAGFSAYLTKPVHQSQLFDAIALVMGSRVSPTFVTAHTVSEARSRARPRVLVAEDNSVNQQVAVAMLTRLGYRADVVANGAEAVEALSRIPYGAVLMDWQMPEMDGHAATVEIRRREQGEEHVPIIAMTAGAMAGDRQRCLAAGMDDYVSKPVSLEDLGAVLKRWIEPKDDDTGGSPGRTGTVGPAPFDADRVASLAEMMASQPGGFVGLVRSFLDDIAARLATVRTALGSDDTETVLLEVHTIMGAAAAIGAHRLSQACHHVEKMVRSGAAKADPGAIAAIESEFRRAAAWARTQPES